MLAEAKQFDDTHPVRKLFLELQSWKQYPDGVVEVPKQICGTSFFPGGVGLWCEGVNVPRWPEGGLMVLGQDFGNEVSYKDSLSNGSELNTSRTWMNLHPFLESAGVQLERCFFTNIYMGLRKGNTNVKGRFAGSKCPRFKDRCRDFFLQQFRTQLPRAILALGIHTPAFLAQRSAQLRKWPNWSSWGSYAKLDDGKDDGGPVIRGVSFEGVPGHQCDIACLVHPSLRWGNVEGRQWRDCKGNEAEIRMVQAVYALIRRNCIN